MFPYVVVIIKARCKFENKFLRLHNGILYVLPILYSRNHCLEKFTVYELMVFHGSVWNFT